MPANPKPFEGLVKNLDEDQDDAPQAQGVSIPRSEFVLDQIGTVTVPGTHFGVMAYEPPLYGSLAKLAAGLEGWAYGDPIRVRLTK